MRSISASTCAISASAAGVSVVLGSSALTTSAPSVVMTATGPNTSPTISAFIQRDCTIKPSVAERAWIFAGAPGHGHQSIYRRGDMLGEVRAPVGLSVRLPRARRSVSPRCREIIQMARGWLCLHCRDLRSLAQESGVAHGKARFLSADDLGK